MITVFLSKYVFFKIWAFLLLLMFKYSCLHFPTLLPPASPIPSPHPQFYPLVFSICPSCMFIDDPSPILLHYYTPTIPLVSDCLFFISMSLVMFCLLVCLVDHSWVRSYGICLSRTGLFHLALYSPVPCKLMQKVGVPSFFLLHSMPLCEIAIVFWFTHLLMGP